MEFPEKITAEKLETSHPSVKDKQPIFEIIDDLLGGYTRLIKKIDKYLKKKPDEDQEVYAFRKKIFSYNPVVSKAISQLANRLNASNFTVNGTEKEKILTEVRENIDRKGTGEKKFIKDVFLSLIKYQKVYAVIVYPFSEIEPANKYEEEVMEDSRVPFVKLYDNRSVINYGYDENKQLKWIKIRETVEKSTPLEEPQNLIRWTIIDQEKITVYESEIEIVEKRNQFKLKAEIAEEYGFGVDKPKENVGNIKKVSEVEHGYPSLPVVEAEIPDNLWVIKECIFLLLEHLAVHNNLTWTSLIAGQIQRLFTPIQEGSDSMVDYDAARSQTGNHKVLIGSGFSFNETSGSAIQTITSYLDRLENQIENLIYTNGIDGTNRPMQESGTAKAMDFISQENALTTYGEELLAFLQRIYRKIAEFEGATKEDIDQISVSGLNEFVLNSIDTKIQRIQSLLALDVPISDTVMKLVVADLENALTPNCSVIEKEKIRKEREEAFAAEKFPDFNADDLVSMSMNQIISIDTVQRILGFNGQEESEKIQKQMKEMAALQGEIEGMMGGSTEGMIPMEEEPNPDLLTTLTEELATLRGVSPEQIMGLVDIKEFAELSEEEQVSLQSVLIEMISEETGVSEDQVLNDLAGPTEAQETS